MSLSANSWKGLSIACFTIVSLMGAWVAVLLNDRDNQLFVSCGVLFSAGVLLAGGFVHLLNDSNQTFLNLGYDNFQWAFLIAGITIVLLTNMEIVVSRMLDKLLLRRKQSMNVDQSSVVNDNVNSLEDPRERANTDNEEPPESPEFIEEDSTQLNSKQEKDAKFDPLPAILLTVALGIHSFIEGLGIGETPDIAALESAFVAVVFHKGFTAFALAESLISTGFWAKGQRKWFFLSLGIFIFIAIIGIGIGWAASPSSENATAATFVGITSGSFIFVALHELIPEQMDRIDKGKLTLIYPSLSLWAGYGLMSMLALWA